MTVAVGTTAPATRSTSMLGVFGAVLRSEWTKLRSVRSTMWSFLVTVAIIVGLGALFCAARVARADRLNPAELRRFDPAGFSMNGIFLAQLAIGVLGVLVMSSEYATGQIASTFAATPQRLLVLLAKVLVFLVVSFVVGLVACGVAFFLGQSILSQKFATAAIGDPGVVRAIFGGALYLSVLGAFGIGLGAVLRRTAGAIAALVGVLLILPILSDFLPSPWNDDFGKYLPLRAGNPVFHTGAVDAGNLSRPAGFVVFCLWAVVSLVLGAVLLVRRDA